MATATSATTGQGELRAGVLRRGAQVLGTLLLQGTLLFGAAGGRGWGWGWAFLGVSLVDIAITGLLLRRQPETIAERGRFAGMPSWDRIAGGLWGLSYFLGVPLIAGLDRRFAWAGPLAAGWHLTGLIAFAGGLALFSWAMIANAYFSTVARLQPERGQTVCTRGPYRVVRHPGYTGAILQPLGAALLLGSLCALGPAALAVTFMVARTALEDRMLHAGLPGYADYAARVRFRLLPGLW